MKKLGLGLLKGLGSFFVKKDKEGKVTGGALKAVSGTGLPEVIKALKENPKFNTWIGFAGYVFGVVVLLYLVGQGFIELTGKEWLKLLF